MMPFSLERLHGLGICVVKCAPSLIRPALYGRPAPYTVKIGSVFTSTGTGGGQEHTIIWTTLAHPGFILVPIGYAAKELFDISHVRGGTPYGASTLAGGDGAHQPSDEELAIARYQGHYVAGIALKMKS